MKRTRNSKTLASFIKYCKENPRERFWQALLHWSGLSYILWANSPDGKGEKGDTFYWESRVKDND